MNNWWKKYPPYEGGEPYLYLAFSEADAGKVWEVMRLLLERGCRVWYCMGPASSPDEVLRRQNRYKGAALTLVILIAVLNVAARWVVGLVFVFSGFVKGVDPLGTTYKVQEYMTAWSLGGLTFEFTLKAP